MEVMTYVLWVLLLMGSVMKNYMVSVSMPKTGQVMMAYETGVNFFSYGDGSNKNASEVMSAIVVPFNNQNFSWVDTS